MRTHQNSPRLTAKRSGKVLAMFAILLPAMLAVAGLVLDGGGLLNDSRTAQQAADAAATAAARCLYDGGEERDAEAVADEYVRDFNELGSATVSVLIPPASGPLAGDSRSVEVEVIQPTNSQFLPFLGGGVSPKVRARAVARYEPATAGAALVVLDPDPAPLAIPAVGGLLPALPTLLAGFEIIGISPVKVDGAVHVNTTWGGYDEDGERVGDRPGPPYAISVPTGILGDKLRARDIRVVGGVDNPALYRSYVPGDPDPLQANRMPVPDPYEDLEVPSVLSDPARVSTTNRGGLRIVDLPLIDPPRTLQPGVYDYLQIVSGNITFAPGIYIIRGVDPITKIALNITGGKITANGVLFYITNSSSYSAANGTPDDADGETVPPASLGGLLPSVVIVGSLIGNASTYRGLNAAGSPFDGMLIYQRRADRRPIVLVNNLLLGGDDFNGVVYAKWGHVILSGSGFRETRVVAGTLRLITITTSEFAPSNPLPPAEDVFLVE
jgi:hypothetical protein